jgi:hypothetical protein
MRTRFLAGVILLTVALSVPRFGHLTPDSLWYTNLVRYFRGEARADQLRRPNAYRVMVPFIVSLWPGIQPAFGIAVLNVAATVGAHLLFVRYLARLGLTAGQVGVGVLLLVVSFPTVNYASGVLSDPSGFLFFVLSLLLLLRERDVLAAGAISAGVLARESLILVVPIACIDLIARHARQPRSERAWARLASRLALVSGLPSLVYLVLTQCFFQDVQQWMRWSPSVHALWRAVTRSSGGWVTVPATLLPPVLLIFWGLQRGGGRRVGRLPERSRVLLVSIAVVNVAYIIYSWMIPPAYLSGRFIWPLYTVLVPLAAVSIQSTWAWARLERLAEKAFGRLADD